MFLLVFATPVLTAMFPLQLAKSAPLNALPASEQLQRSAQLVPPAISSRLFKLPLALLNALRAIIRPPRQPTPASPVARTV